MKMLFLIIMGCILSSATAISDIYDLSITTFEGAQHSLREYQGRKILVTVLPATETPDDSAYLHRVDSIALSDTGHLLVIAVPSYEDGYSDSISAGLQTFYRNLLDTPIIVTQGMYTHQSSDTLQNQLFHWLTHASDNIHFEQEVGGPGQMYFIDERGMLYGVYGPEAKWSDRVITKMLQKTTSSNP